MVLDVEESIGGSSGMDLVGNGLSIRERIAEDS